MRCAATDPVGLADLGRYSDDDAPVVVIDATTGERWPIWAEIDSNASTPEETALLIHPSKNFASGHRYIVALRNLKDSAGDTLSAPEGFRYYRDDLPSKESQINDQRDRFEGIFDTLRDADVKRSDLYLSWDFTVASDENIAKNILAMRDDAFHQLGDDDLADNVVQGNAPEFVVTSVQNFQKTPGGPLDAGREHGPPRAGDVRGALLHDRSRRRRPGQEALRSRCDAEPRFRRGAGAERHLDGELQLHDPLRRARAIRPGRRSTATACSAPPTRARPIRRRRSATATT